MDPSIEAAVCRLMSERRGEVVAIRDCRSLSGGSISQAWLVDLLPDGQIVAKINAAHFQTAFELEFQGLDELRAVGAIRVPEPLAVEKVGNRAILVSEAIGRGTPSPDFFKRFGQQLASLHRLSQREPDHRFGYRCDNYLGSARQPNGWCDDWPTFVAKHRLGFQIDWARQQSSGSRDLFPLVQSVIKRLPAMLAEASEPPVLLHGDLWSGNYLCDSDGQPVILDPAVYYGHREAELGMLLWMGNCPNEFYEAYNKCWPLRSGWRERAEVYTLYHQLNHLNLFGAGYLSCCEATARRLLR
ncbi:fructosamine kinase family protein [Rosistilla oblonga]|uniref:fructosamine kinase family protein n=1 Tax=Rosistilla oblonga TaxID=2527990 RepID=UPI00308426AD